MSGYKVIEQRLYQKAYKKLSFESRRLWCPHHTFIIEYENLW